MYLFNATLNCALLFTKLVRFDGKLLRNENGQNKLI
jgi:hypothetical protein